MIIEVNPSCWGVKSNMPFPICENVFESLGLGWWEILFHTVNLIILVVALWFLLFKPIKKMIRKHKEKLDDVFEKNKKLEADAVTMKDEYAALIEDAKKEAVKISLEAAQNAKRKSEETIENANIQAKNIIEEAKRETKVEKERLKSDFKDAVGKLGVEIAEKVLEREISERDNNDIIDKCLKEWEDE